MEVIEVRTWHLSWLFVNIMGWESSVIQNFALLCIIQESYDLIQMHAKVFMETSPGYPELPLKLLMVSWQCMVYVQ